MDKLKRYLYKRYFKSERSRHIEHIQKVENKIRQRNGTISRYHHKLYVAAVKIEGLKQQVAILKDVIENGYAIDKGEKK